MKSLRLPDSGGAKPEDVAWDSLDLGREWTELIRAMAPGTTPTEIQRICLRDSRMLTSRRNLIVSSPTNSGKSLIGYLFLLDAVKRGKRVVLLEPFRALAQEKFEELIDLRPVIEKFLGRKFTPKITTGDYALDEETMGAPPPNEGEIVIATPERIEVILRHPQYDGWIDGVGAVCVDEAHLISDAKRGGSLEFVLATFLSRKTPPRILLLSATLGDTEKAIRWLDPCDLASSSTRWPPLRREILAVEGDENPDELISSMVSEVLSSEGTSMMIFVYRKADTIKLSEYLKQRLGLPILAYHSDMPLALKEKIRRSYLTGECRCVVSTTALGTGINLPSTHLIIRDTTFFPEGKIQAPQLHQMMGRAGRRDKQGSSYVILRPSDGWSPSELEDALVNDPMPALVSGLLNFGGAKGDKTYSIARVVLSLLCRGGDEGFSKTDLERFSRSLLAGEELAEGLEEALKWLCNPSVLLAYERQEDGKIFPTVLGKASAQGGLPPEMAASVGRLFRDLMSVDDDLSITSSLSALDMLLLAELISERRFLGGRYSKALGEQVDNWTERSKEKSRIFNQWIRAGDEGMRADELFGSLGLSLGKKKAESAKNQGYLCMRAAAVLWMRGQGTPWTDISRRWGLEASPIPEEEWIRNRSWVISGMASILEIRCFYFHLREECTASDEKVAKAKNCLRRLRAECYQVLGRLKYCSPLGPLLSRMKAAGIKGVGASTIAKLESAGLITPQALSQLTDDQAQNLGIDSKRLGVIRGYLRRR